MATVVLGDLLPQGIAPAVFALVERGAIRHPQVAERLRGEAELRFTEGYPPVRIRFGDEAITVADGAAGAPGVVVTSSLPALVHLVAAPLVGGVPKPTDARGRAALGALAGGSIKLDGSRTLGRRLLALLALDVA